MLLESSPESVLEAYSAAYKNALLLPHQVPHPADLNNKHASYYDPQPHAPQQTKTEEASRYYQPEYHSSTSFLEEILKILSAGKSNYIVINGITVLPLTDPVCSDFSQTGFIRNSNGNRFLAGEEQEEELGYSDLSYGEELAFTTGIKQQNDGDMEDRLHAAEPNVDAVSTTMDRLLKRHRRKRRPRGNRRPPALSNANYKKDNAQRFQHFWETFFGQNASGDQTGTNTPSPAKQSMKKKKGPKSGKKTQNGQATGSPVPSPNIPAMTPTSKKQKGHKKTKDGSKTKSKKKKKGKAPSPIEIFLCPLEPTASPTSTTGKPTTFPNLSLAPTSTSAAPSPTPALSKQPVVSSAPSVAPAIGSDMPSMTPPSNPGHSRTPSTSESPSRAPTKLRRSAFRDEPLVMAVQDHARTNNNNIFNTHYRNTAAAESKGDRFLREERAAEILADDQVFDYDERNSKQVFSK